MSTRPKFHGRKEPYTERGIARVPCTGCGKPSVHQWSACANSKRWLAVCAVCDVELNRLALEFFKFPNREELMEVYIDANA